MRTAALVDKLQAKDATAMPGWQMLKLATINGAKVLPVTHSAQTRHPDPKAHGRARRANIGSGPGAQDRIAGEGQGGRRGRHQAEDRARLQPHHQPRLRRHQQVSIPSFLPSLIRAVHCQVVTFHASFSLCVRVCVCGACV